GRKITKINQDPGISLVQHDAEIQIGYGHDMEFDYDFDTAEKDQEQERLGLEAAVRLQAELDEEERQRISRVYESASSFIVEEWEDIQARVKADEELVQRTLDNVEIELTAKIDGKVKIVTKAYSKKIYGAAYTKLIKKARKLEKMAKSIQARRRSRIVVSDDEDDLEDPSK
nr:hypothetical protein [Tanacetum cinerariifolium]